MAMLPVIVAIIRPAIPDIETHHADRVRFLSMAGDHTDKAGKENLQRSVRHVVSPLKRQKASGARFSRIGEPNHTGRVVTTVSAR